MCPAPAWSMLQAGTQRWPLPVGPSRERQATSMDLGILLSPQQGLMGKTVSV